MKCMGPSYAKISWHGRSWWKLIETTTLSSIPYSSNPLPDLIVKAWVRSLRQSNDFKLFKQLRAIPTHRKFIPRQITQYLVWHQISKLTVKGSKRSDWIHTNDHQYVWAILKAVMVKLTWSGKTEKNVKGSVESSLKMGQPKDAYDRNRPCWSRFAMPSIQPLWIGLNYTTNSKQVWKIPSVVLQTTKTGGRLKEAVEANYAKTQKFWNKEESPKWKTTWIFSFIFENNKYTMDLWYNMISFLWWINKGDMMNQKIGLNTLAINGRAKYARISRRRKRGVCRRANRSADHRGTSSATEAQAPIRSTCCTLEHLFHKIR